MPIKVIDLFAGPGGLGEGFSSLQKDGKPTFKLAISIEKEASAHRTLELRALYRQFQKKDVPEGYFRFLRGELSKNPEDELYRLPEIQEALECARSEVQKLILGDTDPKVVYKRIGHSIGKEECVLIGGPPCQAYSLVGRSRNYGATDKQYSADEDHRNFLYREYLRILSRFQPLIFVMENVKGMLSAKVDGRPIFDTIRRDLEDPYRATRVAPEKPREKHKYGIYSFVVKDEPTSSHVMQELDPHDFVIKSERYGIPQARHRVILLGVREDLSSGLGELPLLQELNPAPTIEQVISDLPKLRSQLSRREGHIDNVTNWRNAIRSGGYDNLKDLRKNALVPNSVSELLSAYLGKLDDSPEETGADKGLERAIKFNPDLPLELADWYRDDRLGAHVVNHETRGHIQGDLFRYLYYSCFSEATGVSPNSTNLPEQLWPKHKNFDTGKFADRFRVQRAQAPGTTVTCHISKDGHYYIHYDPAQCRSLTVREAARIQTFPDNYYFVGNRTQQYVQVGNAVPPLLARKLAAIVNQVIG